MKSINQITHHYFLQKGLASFFVPQTNSTNTWAKENFNSPFSIYLTDEQTQGRGRGKNSWSQALPGSTLLSTWCWELSSLPQPLFPLRVGLALYESCVLAWHELPWALKAPNDIYLKDGKWAGLLIEVVSTENKFHVYVGLGANILAKPEMAKQKTASLVDLSSWEETPWFVFCDSFFKNMNEIQKDPARQQLLPSELQRLIAALQRRPENEVNSALPDGSLVLNSGVRIHWSEL